MSMLKRLSPVILGVVLILHGLANMVLPLRGADAGAPGLWLPPVTALWVIAIVGFVAAGLGVVGVRPLGRAIIPASLVAGVAALAAQFWHPDADLWPGVVLSASLPVLATLYVASAPSSQVPVAHPAWRTVADAAGLALLAWVTASAALWPWHRTWGTTPVEWTMVLPGDRTPRTPALEIMHGVTIDAPPDVVWPWLAQIGQDRGGFYSYSWLERAFGVHVTNADAIRQEWQFRQVGDHVYATQEDYLGGAFRSRPGWVIDRLEPGRVLVLRGWGAFVLQSTPDGRTRLLIRSTISHPRIPAWLAAINFTAFELPHFVMQRRMMLGIKERAERTATGRV